MMRNNNTRRLAEARQAGFLKVNDHREQELESSWWHECERDRRPFVLARKRRKYFDVEIDALTVGGCLSEPQIGEISHQIIVRDGHLRASYQCGSVWAQVRGLPQSAVARAAQELLAVVRVGSQS